MDPVRYAGYVAGKAAAEKAYAVEKSTNVPPPPWAQSWLKEPSKTNKSVTVPSDKKEQPTG